MITSRMNRNNGGSRSSRIFIGLLLVTIACLVILYYNEHRSAQDAEALSKTVEEQTRTLDESVGRFSTLKKACSEEREQLNKVTEDQETKIETALRQAEDWQQRYERVINDKNSLEDELVRVKSDLESLEQKTNEKDSDMSSLRAQLTAKAQQCNVDKQSAADEAARNEQSRCLMEKQQLAQERQQLEQELQQLRGNLEQCENKMKLFSDQLKKDTDQQGVKESTFHSAKGDAMESMNSELAERLKQKLLEQMGSDKPSQSVEQPTAPPALGNVDINNYFKDKPRQDVPVVTLDDEVTVATTDNTEGHMVSVKISHDKSNGTVVAMATNASVQEQHDDFKSEGENVVHNDSELNDDSASDHVGETGTDDDDDFDQADSQNFNNQQFENLMDNSDLNSEYNKLLTINRQDDDDHDGNHDNTEDDHDLELPQIPDLSL